MRWGKKTYANVRPVRWRPGYASPLARPEGIDYVIVRENLEDMYVGVMGPAKAAAGRWSDRWPLPCSARCRQWPLRGEDHHPARHRTGHPLRLRTGIAERREADRVCQDEHAASHRSLVLRHRP